MKKILILLSAFLALQACSEKNDSPAPAPDPAFTNYVTGFTSGVVSVNTIPAIQLSNEMSDSLREAVLAKKIFEFKPALKGSLAWTGSRILEFRPEEMLKPATTYNVKFHLGELYAVEKELTTMEFQFKTMQQSLHLEVQGLNSLDDEKLQWQQLKGEIRTSDFAPAESMPEVLRARQNGKDLNIIWTHNESSTLHSFVVDSIHRTKEMEEVELSWKGSPIGGTEQDEEVVNIPPLGDFKLMNVQVHQHPEQFFQLYFSDPLNKTQDLEGLIYLESGEALRLERSGNQVKAYPLQRLQGKYSLLVSEAVRNTLDYGLVEEYKRVFTLSSIDPDVELLGDGVILPSSGGLVLPFRAVNLKAVNVKIIRIYENNIGQFFQENQYDGRNELRRVGRMILKKEIALHSDKPIDYGTWNVFSLDLADLIRTEPGAIYNISITFDRDQTLLPCAGQEEEDEQTFREDREMEGFNNPPAGGYYWDYGPYETYNWRERDDPCTDSYYAYRHNQNNATRNVLASDLGLIAKAGSGTDLVVAVTDINTSRPLPGINLEVFNYQNQLMNSRQTDQQGMASIPLEHKPFLLVAKHGDQRGYLRLDDGSALSTSMFDVGGSKNSMGIKGFLYGERGVWRPGDSIYITFVLEDMEDRIPENHPVRFELFTPENQLYLSRISTRGRAGMYDFRTATDADAPTGNWLAKVRVGGNTFSKSIKIETVKPNRLKINLDFGNTILERGKVTGKLHSTWLHGATARYLDADIEMTLKPAKTGFTDYPDYVFDDPVKDFESEAGVIFDGRLDSAGVASFSTDINVGEEAPGMLQAFFKTRVFEQSGDFSVDRFPVPYAPYTNYVGVKIPEGPGWNNALYSNEDNLIPIVTVDAHGNPVDIKRLVIEIYDVRWRWWWDRSSYDDLSSYVRNRSTHLIKRDRISTVNGKALYTLNFDKRLWGRKLIRITDPHGGHSTGQTFYLDYRGYWDTHSQEGPGGAEMLSFSTDKKEYQVGEEIQVMLPEFSEGRALVSLENGSSVIRTFWLDAPHEGPLSIEASPEMAPNVYVHVSLIQPFDQHSNDRPIRLYGIQSVNVIDPATRLNPILDMPESLEPEKEVEFSVSEADGRAMTYTVAVVDEGLLDLTRFPTPDLWKMFYAREALGIRTWDLYKYILGAQKGEMAGLLSIGGDEFIKQDGKKNKNRFKPVVKYFGPYTLKAGKENTHRFTMPNYVGSVRTMVVASQDGAYGKTEKTTPVKKPLMVLATLPRVVSPGETLTLPLTVFAMDPSVKEVELEVSSNELFEISGERKKRISFSEEGDQVVNYELKVARSMGWGSVDILARSGRREASDHIDLQVRMPNPPISTTRAEVLEAGKEWKGVYTAVGLAGTNSGVMEVSAIPSMDLERRLDYLITYPHGCVEQSTSAVFPQLYLDRLLGLDQAQKEKIQENINAGIKKLVSFQRSNGGLSYWPGSYSSVSEWGTSYAGHFMLEARKLGYNVPQGFIPGWVKYQSRQANSWERDVDRYWSRRANEINQAYRLYTLALAGKPALGAMNRMRELKGMSTSASWTLAGAYLQLGKEEVARELISGLSTVLESYRELSHTYGSEVRDQAIILEVVNLLGDEVLAKKLVDELADKMRSRSWYSTQTVAWVLSSVAHFIGEGQEDWNFAFDYRLNGKQVSVESESPVYRIDLPYQGEEGGSIELQNKSRKKIFLNMQLSGTPLDQKVENTSSNLEMSVRYLNLDGKEINPSSLVQGSDFMLEVKLRHPGVRDHYRELALTQMLPSGWEIRNLRLDGLEGVAEADRADYQDIRDDRVYTYFGLNKGESKTFVLMLNAAYQGKYFLPAINCSAMYDADIHATRSGQWVTVHE